MKKQTIQRATIHNMDCMEFMKGCEDNQFSLAICDPPYGIGISSNPVRQQHVKKEWDNSTPCNEYFKELRRVSHNQIIWGGNYFLDFLGSSQGFLIWDKVQPHDFSLAMAEFAWISFQRPAKIWKRSVLSEMNKIHPTQKPVALYEWLLTNYAKQGDSILDTHMGSGSIAIATNKLGFDLTACELDKDYYTMACERVRNASKQIDMFTPPVPEQKQEDLL